MPPISELQNVDVSGYTRTVSVQPPPSMPEQQLMPRRNPALRANAIFIQGTFPSSDTLTGYHLGSQMPQYRAPLPPPAPAQGAGSTTTSAAIITSSSSSTTNNPAKAQTASVATAVIAPGAQFTGVVTMAKAFVVLQISVNAAARIRLYGTLAAQSADLSRPTTQGPGYGTEQNIIGDIILDTTPVVWQATNMTGYNSDNPQSTAAYITVDNISQSSTAIQVSIVYVPIES